MLDDLEQQVQQLRRDVRGLVILCCTLAVCLIIVALAR